jgi:hypothetical protein
MRNENCDRMFGESITNNEENMYRLIEALLFCCLCCPVCRLDTSHSPAGGKAANEALPFAR